MTFRVRITLALFFVALTPLALVGYFVRRDMTTRLTTQAKARQTALVTRVRSDVSRELQTTRIRLRAFGADLAAENRFRLESTRDTDRGWLLDWASTAMRASGLDLLVIQDSAGRVLSSGQFRNEFDRVIPLLPQAASRSPSLGSLIVTRTPEGSIRALAAADSFVVGGRRYTIVGGQAFESGRFAVPDSGADVSVALAIGKRALPTDSADVIELPYLDLTTSGGIGTATLTIARDGAPIADLVRRVDRFFLLAFGVGLALALGFALWLGSRITGPLEALAQATERLELDRSAAPLDTGRADEIGTLARALDLMTGRLQRSATRVKDAERRAALGDLARQVNHDVKNALVPIRNVVRHLSQVAEREPDRMSQIFLERRGTLESSVEYLDGLAKQYARLAPVGAVGRADLNRMVELAVGSGLPGITIGCDLAGSLPEARVDPLALRRVIENLLSNAGDAARAGGRTVDVRTGVDGNGQAPMVTVSVRDSGPGMAAAELERAFEDFYTTKPAGTGLGLSIVRRLVADAGGTLKVETEPGRGTTFTVAMPIA